MAKGTRGPRVGWGHGSTRPSTRTWAGPAAPAELVLALLHPHGPRLLSGGGKLHCTSEYVKAGEAARGEGNPNAPNPPELGQTVQRNLCKNETKGLETTPETPQAALINTRAGCSWREAGQPSLTAPGAPSAAMRLLVLQCWRQLSGNAEGMCFRVNFAPVYCVSSEKGCTKLGPG